MRFSPYRTLPRCVCQSHAGFGAPAKLFTKIGALARYDASMFPKEYKIISAESAAKLEKKVNEAMADGWHLIGGVAVSAATESALVLQAVAK
jgi:hypothetical protein